MIRVAIVDDHHAVRLGLQTALGAEPGLVPVGTASTAAELAPLLYRVDPDVVLLDYQLPDNDGLTVCRQVITGALAAGDPLLGLRGRLDGRTFDRRRADGLVHKGVRPQELFEAIRTVAAGGVVRPLVSQPLLEAAGLQLDTDDLPILGMLLDRTEPADIAMTLGIDDAHLKRRVRHMLERLKSSSRDQHQRHLGRYCTHER